MKRWVPLLLLAASLAPAALVRGDEAQCRTEVPRLSPEEYLRAVSLDVRGVVPTVEEYESIRGLPDVPEAMIDEWLASEEFGQRVVRRHRALLWPNAENVRFVDFRRRLGSTGTGAAQRWYRSSQTTTVAIRGANVPCDDVPATFDADGRPEYRIDSATGAHIEGWVEVSPYYAPTTTIHVCAFDAETAERSPSGRECRTRDASADPGCGCGASLMWCDTNDVQLALVASFNQELERRIAAHVAADEPYTGIFTSRRAFVNGPIAFYYQHLSRVYNDVPLEPASLDVEHMPTLAYTDRDTWMEVELPDVHAGVLTSPLYLLRFQTNRARANRFFDAFLCQPFQPPAGGLPVADEVEAREPDLQRRAGCRYCHAILEPAAAHWGRWMMQGGGYLAEGQYPVFRPECAECARGEESCGSVCTLNYTTRALYPEQEPYLGMLRAYEFLRPEHEINVAEGPTALVRDGLADGRFTECTVRRTTEWLLARDLGETEVEWSSELASTFVGSDLRYRDVVRAIVTSDTYRRVR